MNLYWCTTDDHDEDWLIVAASARSAAKLHEDLEGYEHGDAGAEKILNIPDSIVVEPGWPPEELLLDLGAKVISRDGSRVVEIAGRMFCEGMLESVLNEKIDDMFEMRGLERLNDTKKKREN